MRRRNPEACKGAIRYQNQILANQHVVMIVNLGTEAMYHLSYCIKSISGVKDVISTENGKFYVLVDKNIENTVHESLTKRFDRWYQEVVPEDAKTKEGQFEGPPSVGNRKADGYSSGDNSWMTTSTKSCVQYRVASMETDMTSTDAPYFDSAWEQRTATSTQSFETTPVPQTSKKTYPSYAAAART